MTKLNEREIISLFVTRFKANNYNNNNKNKKPVIRLGEDDISVVPVKNGRKSNSKVKLIFKSDMLVESTDVPAGMKLWQIARKSIVSCVSDLSAKGIKPRYALISIGIPKQYSKREILDLIRGFQIASEEYGVEIVGGDTNESNELIIDCSMVGFFLEDTDNNIPRRSGARPGDFIVVSGEFGYSSSGLKILISNAKAQEKFRKNAILSVVRPKPQQKFGISLAKYFSSSIDSSDGLAMSLYELARQSKVNFFVNNIPSAKGIKQFAEDNHLDVNELIFYGGEEYEIVATVPSKNMKKAESIVRKAGLKLYVIGKVKKGNSKVFAIEGNNTKKYSLVNNRGYLHLSPNK
jgi:thiamine-monophosphate kinase